MVLHESIATHQAEARQLRSYSGEFERVGRRHYPALYYSHFWIGWGRELIYLYNDPYKSIIGGKHPRALGQPTSAVWKEIWDDIGPLLAKAMGGEQGTYVEAQLLIMERNGFPEETYYTFSYSPIPNADGSPGGIFCANTDDTQRVIGERQLSLLRELASGAAESRSVQEACESSAKALSSDPKDMPFAMIYLVDRPTRTARLAALSGLDNDHPAVNSSFVLEAGQAWPLHEALHRQEVAGRRPFEAVRNGISDRRVATVSSRGHCCADHVHR